MDFVSKMDKKFIDSKQFKIFKVTALLNEAKFILINNYGSYQKVIICLSAKIQWPFSCGSLSVFKMYLPVIVSFEIYKKI